MDKYTKRTDLLSKVIAKPVGSSISTSGVTSHISRSSHSNDAS